MIKYITEKYTLRIFPYPIHSIPKEHRWVSDIRTTIILDLMRIKSKLIKEKWMGK